MKLLPKKYVPITFLCLLSFFSSSLTLSASLFNFHPLAQEENQSPEDYYNSALSDEEKGKSLEASIALRRALVLEPTFLEAREHLETLLKKLNLPADTGWRVSVASHASPEKLILIGSLLGWIAALFLVWLFFAQKGIVAKRKLWWVLSICFFLLGHGMTLLGVVVDPRISARHEVIINLKRDLASNLSQEKASETPLRSTPVDNSDIIIQLPNGSVATLLSCNGVWSYVLTQSGQKGWIPSSVMQSLIPQSKN